MKNAGIVLAFTTMMWFLSGMQFVTFLLISASLIALSFWMKNAVIILSFTLLTTFFYRYVGNLVPQKEVPAPVEVDVTGDLSPEKMVEVGKTLVDGRCMSCHGIQPRFPDLKGIGSRAGSQRQKDGYSDVDYLAETLYEPDVFIVEPFAKGMTPANKPPLNLNDKEILTVIAYLQSLGGTVSVTMQTKLKYQGAAGSAPASPTPAAASAAPAALSAEQIVTNYGCGACHSLTTKDKMVGPSLYDIGKRQNKAQIYESLMEPDAVIGDEFAAFKGMMGGTLSGNGFYAQLTSEQLKKLVDYLAELKGEG